MDKGLNYTVNIKNGDFGGAAKIKAELQGLDNVITHTDEVIVGLSKVITKASAIITNGFNIKGVGSVIEHVAASIGGNGPANLVGASVLVGKALQNPIKGFATLQSVAAKFSEVQKGATATEIKNSQAQKNHGSILQHLQTEFGKSAQSIHHLMGPVGDLKGAFDKLGGGLDGLINDGLDVAIPLFSDVKKITDALTTAQQVLTVTQEALAAGQEVLTAGQWALNVAMDANPVGLIITGIALLVGGLYMAYQKSETFRAVLAGVGEVAEELVPIFKGLGEIILGALTLNPSMVIGGFKDAYSGVQKLISDGGISGAFNKGYDKSLAESKKADEAQKNKEKDGAGKISGLLPKGGGKDHPLAKVARKPAISGHPANANKPHSLTSHGAGKTGKHNSPAVKQTKGASRGATSLTGGGAVKSVHITIGKLIERLEFHTTNIQGISKSEIKKQLTELLVGAVHDSELALG